MIFLVIRYSIKIDGTEVLREEDICMRGYNYPWDPEDEGYIKADILQFLRNLYPEHANKVSLGKWFMKD